jgi:hypothetical protein
MLTSGPFGEVAPIKTAERSLSTFSRRGRKEKFPFCFHDARASQSSRIRVLFLGPQKGEIARLEEISVLDNLPSNPRKNSRATSDGSPEKTLKEAAKKNVTIPRTPVTFAPQVLGYKPRSI